MITTGEDVSTKSSRDDLRQQLINNRDDKDYRHAYADESLNISIATQIKVLREQRKLKQKGLATLATMKQSMISRYENVNYSSWSINTLKKLAEAFDVVLDVRFRSFGDLVSLTEGFNRESLEVPSFGDDPYFSVGFKAPQVYTVSAYLQETPQILNSTQIVGTQEYTLGYNLTAFSSSTIMYAHKLVEFKGAKNAEEPKATIPFIPTIGSPSLRAWYPAGNWTERIPVE